MIELIESAYEAVKLLEPIEEWIKEVEPTQAMAIVPMLFDYICEIHKLDKDEECNLIGRIIKKVNQECGPMLGEKAEVLRE